MTGTPTYSAHDSAYSRALLNASVEGAGARPVLLVSTSKPSSVHPIVPFLSATTLFGIRELTSDCVPTILRVRPAQLTITVVSGEGTASRTRYNSSPPGQLRPLGILIVLYSSKRRASRIATSLLLSSTFFTSRADKDGVWLIDSTSSPNALDGTFTSRYTSPTRAYPDSPPSRMETSVYPSFETCSAARET